jgi:hypothetical protein
MSEKHESNLGPEKGCDEQCILNQKDRQNQSRRKFIKGAAAATPVVLSVASRPVWARNCSLSGQLSGNLSDQGDPKCSGEGCVTTFWMNNTNLYHPKFPYTMLFSSAFGRDAFPGKTILQVIQKDLLPPEIPAPAGCTPTSKCKDTLLELGAQSVAALQNSASPMQYDLDVEMVIMSFQQSYDKGMATADITPWNDTITAFSTFNNQICTL